MGYRYVASSERGAQKDSAYGFWHARPVTIVIPQQRDLLLGMIRYYRWTTSTPTNDRITRKI